MSDATDEAREQIVQDAHDGIQSVTVDGMTTQAMSPRQRLEAIRDEERREQSESGVNPLRFTPVRSVGL